MPQNQHKYELIIIMRDVEYRKKERDREQEMTKILINDLEN